MGIKNLAELIDDSDLVVRLLTGEPKTLRGKVAEEAGNLYRRRVELDGGIKNTESCYVDCMDAAYDIAKREYSSSEDGQALEKLGWTYIKAKSRQNAIECFELAKGILEKKELSLHSTTEEKLKWLKNDKTGCIKTGLCDEFAFS